MNKFVLALLMAVVAGAQLGAAKVKCYNCTEPCPSPRPTCEDNFCYFVGSTINNTDWYGCSANQYIDWIPGNHTLGECTTVRLGVADVHFKVCDKDFCNEACSATTAVFSVVGIVFSVLLHSKFFSI